MQALYSNTGADGEPLHNSAADTKTILYSDKFSADIHISTIHQVTICQMPHYNLSNVERVNPKSLYKKYKQNKRHFMIW